MYNEITFSVISDGEYIGTTTNPHSFAIKVNYYPNEIYHDDHLYCDLIKIVTVMMSNEPYFYSFTHTARFQL